MIPNNMFTDSPVVTGFIPPYDLPYTPMQQIVLGGIAISDPSKGRMFQTWTAYYESGNINIKPTNGAVVETIPAPGAISISLAFDNNMGIVLCWQTSTGSVLYYYDTVAESYVTNSTFGLGTTSCRVAVDDPRDSSVTASDVIFAYTLNGRLYWRQQRDRYVTQYSPSTVDNPDLGLTSKRLIKMAPSLGNRLQFELV